MLYDSFQKQVRTSQSAPVQVDGGSIGMVRCDREVMMTVRCSTSLSSRWLRGDKAFENLIAAKIFVCVTPVPAGTTKEFVRYKCMVENEEVKRMVSAIGQTTLNQWYKRAQ